MCGSILLVLTACGETNQNEALDLDDKYFEVALGLSTGKGGRAGSGEGLGLLSGKDVRIKYSISGCKSGFKKSVTEFVSVADLSLRFYRGDSGCTVRLDSIRLQASGKTGFSDYAIDAGSPDSSFAVAGPSPATQAKIYKSSSSPNQVLLVKDIPFDMKTNTSLDFIFQSVSGDVTTKAIANVAMSQPLGTAALEAPNFEIPFDSKSPESPNMGLSLSSQGAVYSGGSAGGAEANGGFQIDVLMRCGNNVSLGTAGAVNTTANCPTPAGDAMKVHDLQLAVVMCRGKDDRLTYAEAAALFSATPSSRVMSAPSSLVPVIKSGVNFSSQATSDFITGLRFKGVKTHFPSAAIAGTAIDKGCVFDQASQAKGWMILRKTEGSGSSQVASYQVTNIELSASTSVAAIAAAMKEEVKIFDYTGSLESFKIPAGVTSVEIKAWGGGGCVFDETPNYAASHNADFGGAGGFSSAKVSVKPDEILYIQVGQGGQKYGTASGGYPNGGDGYNGGCAGGGSSNVFVNGYGSQDKLLLVAGGGGGAGWYTPSGSSRQGNGAAGGGLIAQSGTANPGAGGNQSQGGQTGNGKGLALKGGSSSGNGGTGGPGAGGGGYFGGASGVGGNNNTNGGGGGGSCYVGLASDGKVLTSNAGEGDAKDYIDPAGTTRTVGGRSFSTAECLSGNGKNSPKKSDPHYASGIAMGGEIANVTQVPGWSVNHKIAKGGNGRVVLRYMVPATQVVSQQSVASASVFVDAEQTKPMETISSSELTMGGGAQRDTAIYALGNASLTFKDGAYAKVNLPGGLGSKAWTIEGWFYLKAKNSTYQMFLSSFDVGAFAIGVNGQELVMGVNGPAGGDKQKEWHSPTWNALSQTSLGVTPDLNRWYHFALVFTGSEYLSFVDGKLKRLVSSDVKAAQFSVINLGSGWGYYGTNDSYPSNVNLDNISISVGSAKYTTNFSPVRLATVPETFKCPATSGSTEENANCKVDWTMVDALVAGSKIQVKFDSVGSKFNDSNYTGNYTTDPMGTLKGGETYTVNFDKSNGAFAVHGFNQGSGAAGTWTYSNGDVKNGVISLWGRNYFLNQNAQVIDPQYGFVGRACVNSCSEGAGTSATALSEDFYKDSAGRILILSAATAGKDPRTLTKTTGKVLSGTDSCIDDARWQKFIELAKTENYRVTATLDGSTKPVTKASDWNLKKMINANQVKLKTSLTDWHLIPYAYTLYVLAWDETSGATVTGGDYSLWSWGGTSYYYGYYGQSSNSFFDQTTYSNQTANWWILPPGVPDFP